MAITESKTKKQSLLSMNIGGGKGKSKTPHGKMPTKQSINLIIIDDKKINPAKAVIAIVVIAALAAVFSKFMVIDRITAMSEATGRVSELRSTLEVMEAQMEEFSDVQEEYAHYTYSGMTTEEQEQVDRTAVLEMASAVFASGSAVNSWHLTGNILTAEVTGKNLSEINELAQILEQYPIVDRCAITMANKTIKNEEATDVQASFIVYLQQPEEGGEES